MTRFFFRKKVDNDSLDLNSLDNSLPLDTNIDTQKQPVNW